MDTSASVTDVLASLERADDAASAATLAADPRTARWEETMAPFFVALDGARADQGAPQLPEVFHLADQLAAQGLRP